MLAVERRLERAVANLLDNAVKWSPPGGRVEVRVADGELSVRDHGPGIAPEDLPHIFDRFYRSAAARGLPGSGLGLAIVRQVAETQGGSVSVAQRRGRRGGLHAAACRRVPPRSWPRLSAAPLLAGRKADRDPDDRQRRAGDRGDPGLGLGGLGELGDGEAADRERGAEGDEPPPAAAASGCARARSARRRRPARRGRRSGRRSTAGRAITIAAAAAVRISVS